MEHPYTHLGDLIRERRSGLGLTQEQLAARAHTYQESVSDWERGARQPDRDSLRRLALALGIDDLTLMAEARARARRTQQKGQTS